MTMRLVQNLQKEMMDMKAMMAQQMEQSRLEVKQLKADIIRETARAMQAEQALERTTTAQADSIDDTTSFIASGCREDTLAYYRIKVRHLINLAQAQLAYCTSLSTTSEEREATKLWRRYCHSLIDVSGDGRVNTKVDQAKKFIRENRSAKDVTNTNALIQSGALEILVNDWDLRSEGDVAAHPGPLKKDDVEGYKLAIAAVGNDVTEGQLTGCISYVITVGSSKFP